MTTPAQPARDARKVELSHMTKRDLIRACLNRGIVGGMYQLEEWSKDDLIASLLSAEFPAATP